MAVIAPFTTPLEALSALAQPKGAFKRKNLTSREHLDKVDEMNSKQVIDFALTQLDNLGYELQRRGISGQVNRHNLAALAMTKQQQLKGEMARYELKLAIQKNKLEKARQQALDSVDNVIEQLPAPIAAQVSRARKLVA